MKFKRFCILFVLILFAVSGCKTDFEVNAPWKDITVVYGLLDQSQTTQYIRINKAFLGEGDALIMAKCFDSTNYKKEDLEVKLEEYTIESGNNYVLKASYPLEWALLTKDDGVFYDPNNPKQTVYKTNILPNESYHYQLVITNLNTGKIISAGTDLVRKFSIFKPGVRDKYNFFGKQEIEWVTAINGRAYQLIIRFHYDEINKTTHEIAPKYVDWIFPKLTVNSLAGGQSTKYSFFAEQFYVIVSSAIPVNPNVDRKPGKVDFSFLVAGDDLNTYIDVNKPSNSVVQEKPEYTNISNGIGIFSSRYTNVRTIDLSTKSIDSLIKGRYTKNLRFYDPNAPSSSN